MEQNQEDKIISEFLHSIGPWRKFIVIGGGFALFIYKLYLVDQKLENTPVGTRDIDSLMVLGKNWGYSCIDNFLWDICLSYQLAFFLVKII